MLFFSSILKEFVPSCLQGGLHCVEDTGCQVCHSPTVSVNFSRSIRIYYFKYNPTNVPICADDVINVDILGQSLTPGQKPSAETLLHCQLYRNFPPVGAVLHGHSVAATVLSMLGPIRFSGYEILKAFGFATHDMDVDLPVYENDQDIGRLAAKIDPLLLADPPIGYVISGHGVYAWGSSVEHAFWRLEALEFLLNCELERRRLT
ncbi:MAG: methylthioribulose 1-phosphate dehydratase [Acidocella sp.]|nr:methylthioribulose 1-phosphate dehydratase [Acidocella sp.]